MYTVYFLKSSVKLCLFLFFLMFCLLFVYCYFFLLYGCHEEHNTMSKFKRPHVTIVWVRRRLCDAGQVERQFYQCNFRVVSLAKIRWARAVQFVSGVVLHPLLGQTTSVRRKTSRKAILIILGGRVRCKSPLGQSCGVCFCLWCHLQSKRRSSCPYKSLVKGTTMRQQVLA